MKKTITSKLRYSSLVFLFTWFVNAQVVLESEVHITDLAMYFDGNKVALSTSTNSQSGYDYVYGTALTPHGDCIKAYENYVFMTWYRGGKNDRHVMLTRYNKDTGVKKTIEFPHQHTGYNGKWWIGETHNTIAVGICPKDGTIHMVYDMHRNGNVAAFSNDYLRYSYSVKNAATVSDDEFDINLFVQSPNNNYKHLAFPGITDTNTTKLLTYPAFFTNDQGDLFMKNRFGYSENGKFLFAKYDGHDWEGYTDFNRTGASGFGSEYNWGLYGDMKYLNGKIRIGFQRRSNNRQDKYLYQNGFYYAYSDDPSGLNQWKDHEGLGFSRPLAIADKILISEPGDEVSTTQKNAVYMVSGFDWTVTENNDIHFIGKVKDNENNVTKYVHTYKPAGATSFTTSTNFSGAETLYSSGDNVYIIGLNSSGRPRIKKASGGTNLFTTVYEATTGKRFRKGQAYIYEGKLYYYLLENNTTDSDDTQPTYMQIIDLGIDNGPKPFAVNVVSPIDNESFDEGEIVQLFANATTDSGEIEKVEFFIDDISIAEDTTKPYLLDWVAQSIGRHTVKAKLYKKTGETTTSLAVTIEVTEVDHSDLTNDTYRLKNIGTGKFLTDSGVSATAVEMSNSGEETDRHWTFVESGDYYNIDSETFGVLRATGSAFPAGAYFVVSTTKSSPTSDTDKVWTIHYHEIEDTFRFESKNNDRFLYQDTNGDVTNISIDESDVQMLNRSKWKAIATSESLTTSIMSIKKPSIKIFPNPVLNQRFTIVLNNTLSADLLIYNAVGRMVYKGSTSNGEFKFDSTFVFSPGVYLVKVMSSHEETSRTKLMIR